MAQSTPSRSSARSVFVGRRVYALMARRLAKTILLLAVFIFLAAPSGGAGGGGSFGGGFGGGGGRFLGRNGQAVAIPAWMGYLIVFGSVAAYLYVLVIVYRTRPGRIPRYRIYRVLFLVEPSSLTLHNLASLVSKTYFTDAEARTRFLCEITRHVSPARIIASTVEAGPAGRNIIRLHRQAERVFSQTLRETKIDLKLANIPGRTERSRAPKSSSYRAEAAFLSIVFVAAESPECLGDNATASLLALSRLPPDGNSFLWFTYAPHSGDELSGRAARNLFEKAQTVPIWTERPLWRRKPATGSEL